VIRYTMFRCAPTWRDRKILKILPHILDTALLAFAIALCVTLAQYPGQQAWLTAKVIGLLAYIGFGVIAIRRGHLWAFGLALLSYAYIIGAVFNHSALSWGYLLVGGHTAG
ncbi:MAG: SirB2 family protein, partial [Gammaproteobacteria bacterium]